MIIIILNNNFKLDTFKINKIKINLKYSKQNSKFYFTGEKKPNSCNNGGRDFDQYL